MLVTNTRDFVLVGENAAGRPAKLESIRLADTADDFDRKLDRPSAFAREVGASLGEYLSRALSHRATIAEPRDLAWLLASYARDVARLPLDAGVPDNELERQQRHLAGGHALEHRADERPVPYGARRRRTSPSLGPAHGDGNGLRCPEVENVDRFDAEHPSVVSVRPVPWSKPRRKYRGSSQISCRSGGFLPDTN